jgi:hypothetical protein
MTAPHGDDFLLRRAKEIFYSLPLADQAAAVRLMVARASDMSNCDGLGKIDLLLRAVDRPTRAEIIRRLLKSVTSNHDDILLPDASGIYLGKIETFLPTVCPKYEGNTVPDEPDFEQPKQEWIIPLRIIIFYAVVVVAVGFATGFEMPNFMFAAVAAVFMIGLNTARRTSF